MKNRKWWILIPYNIISTGSKGNAVVIGGIILVDCGVPFSALSGVYRDIKIVLLTHIHVDHFKHSTIRKLASERPTLRFACGKWLVNDLIDSGVNPANIDVLNIGEKYDYGAFKVVPIKLYHNAPNCGYRLYFGDKKVFYATDTSSLAGITAKNYDLYMVEANYELDKLIESINEKSQNGEYAYERNVLQNHLSKTDCDEFINANKGPHSKWVYLHQHKYEIEDVISDDNISKDN